MSSFFPMEPPSVTLAWVAGMWAVTVMPNAAPMSARIRPTVSTQPQPAQPPRPATVQPLDRFRLLLFTLHDRLSALVDRSHPEILRCDQEHRFDPLDVPRDRFLLAGEAWRRCRSGEDDPDRFGVDEDSRGIGFVRGYLLHDLAALKKVETLCWDSWGLGVVGPGEEPTGDDLALLDRVVAVTISDSCAETRAMYEQDDRLRVGEYCTSYSPAKRNQICNRDARTLAAYTLSTHRTDKRKHPHGSCRWNHGERPPPVLHLWRGV